MASVVVVWCGPRGSGKTLSMSVEGAIALVNGMPVWANYPISFDVRYSAGRIVHYESIPVEIEDLITFKPEIRDGLILLDELNLWASNRGHAGMVNRLLNSWIQLIRKRGLSLQITTQSFHSLDIMIRWQCDLSITCKDLHFSNHRLPEGAAIGQRLTDQSGMFTGHDMYEWGKPGPEEFKRNSRYRTLNGRRFWGIYDSWTEFDILQAMTKYQVNRAVRTIGQDDMTGAYEAGSGDWAQDLAATIKNDYPRGGVFDQASLFEQLQSRGATGGKRRLANLLESAGFIPDGDTFILPEDDARE